MWRVEDLYHRDSGACGGCFARYNGILAVLEENVRRSPRLIHLIKTCMHSQRGAAVG